MENDKLNKKFKITIVIFIITVIITLIIILGKGKIFGIRLVSLSGENAEETHSIQVIAGNSNISVDEGQTELYITIDGEDITDGFTAIVSDDEVISVEGTTVTALSEGTATITIVSDEYEITGDVTINVIQTITKLTLNSEYKKIDIGEENQMSCEYTPEEATVEITYASSDESIATVDENGIVVGVSSGKATIIATDEITGKTASYSIEVMD